MRHFKTNKWKKKQTMKSLLGKKSKVKKLLWEDEKVLEMDDGCRTMCVLKATESYD